MTSARKNDMDLICVTFNCGDDWNAHLNLFDYGFSNFEMKTIMEEGIIQINNDFYETTPFLPFDIVYPLKNDEKIDIIVYLLNNPKKNNVGKVCLYLDKKNVYTCDIYRYY